MSANRMPLALALALACALFADPAIAHPVAGEHDGFTSGFWHPLYGTDHLLAMVAVGLWAAALGGRARLFLPAAFVAAMIAGFGMAFYGMAMPAIEPLILASVMVLGLGAALGAKTPVLMGVALTALFGLAHGAAHGLEMPLAVSAATYGAGFALATAMLHGGGVLLGMAIAKANIRPLLPATGGAIAGAGLMLVIGG